MSLNTPTTHWRNRKRLAEEFRGERLSRSERSSRDGDDLKSVVRDGLISMKFDARIEFIQELEAEMRRSNLSMRAYLIPLGISASTPEELTPTEVGHLIRFLKIIVPGAMPAVERTMARFEVFEGKVQNCSDFLAA
jgi:hypothetical protein